METRLQTCVEAWPECHEGGYNPRCCRFPKSCSYDVHDHETQPTEIERTVIAATTFKEIDQARNFLKALRKQGYEVVQTTTVGGPPLMAPELSAQVMVRMTPELLDAVKRRADIEERSMAEVIRTAIERHFLRERVHVEHGPTTIETICLCGREWPHTGIHR